MTFTDEDGYPRPRKAGETIQINEKSYTVIEEVFLHPEAGNTLDLALPAIFNGVALVESDAGRFISFLEPNSIDLFDRRPQQRVFVTTEPSIRAALSALAVTDHEAKFLFDLVGGT